MVIQTDQEITLINPCYEYPVVKRGKFVYYNKIWPPIDLANCGALLEKDGFKVKIIDANAERLSHSKVAELCKGSEKIFITSTPIDRWECPHPNIQPFINCVHEVRRKNPYSKIFVMGTHGTVRPNEILELTGTDAVIRGEPELTVLDISKDNNLKNINGITYKSENKIISNPDQKLLDLDKLPIPAYHLLPIKKYFYDFLGKNFMLFEGSRGCPFNCIFCLKKTYGDKYRKKSPEKLTDEIKYAVKEFGIRNAFFVDLEFTINKKLVEYVCDFILNEKYNLRWSCQGRLDDVDKIMLMKMRKAGCKLIHYGVETGSERIMRLINKRITFDKIEEGMRLTKEVGIDSVCFFILGFPTETFEDMKKTIDLAIKLNPTYASFHLAIPYPGTVFYEMVKENLNELFPSVYTGIYTEDQLKKIINHAFLKFYLLPTYIFSRLLKGDYKLLIHQLKLFLTHTG